MKTRKIPAAKFKQQCLALMDEVAMHNTEIIITKHGSPVCKLVPLEAEAKKSRFGRLKGSMIICCDLTEPTSEPWDSEVWGSNVEEKDS